MEIVLALAAVLGIRLIAVPRLRRRSRGGVRANAGKQWATTAAARRHRRPAAGARTHGAQGTGRSAAAAGGSGAATAVATETYDEWDDDLDWGGETAVAAAPPAASTAPLPESDLDWRLPGEPNGGAVAEPHEEPVWDDWADAEEPANGNGDRVVAPPVNGDAAAPAVDDAPPAPVDTPERATRHPDAPEPAPLTEPEWDWEPVVSRTPETAGVAAAVAAPARKRRTRGRKLNPLVLVAIYALSGIGLIVIGVNVVSGVMSDLEPNASPRSSATTVQPTPEPAPAAASGAVSAEARQLRQAFLDQRSALIARETRAARSARAAPVTPTPAPPAPTPSSGAGGGRGGGGGAGGGGCEFCIG